MLVGVGNNANIIYLVDFSISEQYRNPDTHVHIIPSPAADSFVGTPAFASINSHLGIELGRRDDLESLVYILIYLFRGCLPWLDGEVASANMALNMKRDIDELCHNLPGEFRQMLDHLRSLAFHAKPNYDYLRALVRKLRTYSSGAQDVFPDWLLEARAETSVLHRLDTITVAEPHSHS